LACDELEAAWQREERPRIEEYLVGFSESDLPRVLRELLLVELAYRRSREEPAVEEYCKRFPQHVEVIEAVFRDSEATELPPADFATARSLLFGIFAFEHCLIDMDTLLAGLRAWVSDKTRSLGEILEAERKLSASDHELLSALLDRHLAVHEDSPQRSLASLSLVGAAWKELAEGIVDPEIRTCLRYIPGDRGMAGSSGADHPGSVGASSSAGSRFRIVRFHKEGGLGQVWVAADEELHRDVALKDIKARHADVEEFRSRFVTEAEITGGLEHPGVVPVYGLGQYEDGRPFYVMRFIRGDSLGDALERFHAPQATRADPTERALELRQLLGRFIDVCNAIEYAHSRGVLHRDLKPGNIMLGEYGETLVVDWGLAKAGNHLAADGLPKEQAIRPTIVEGSVPTQMGSAIGTPQYMSPEQAAGRLDEMGPATDVYSLGATLYCVLTGRPPFGGPSVSAILDNVQAGRFRRPRESHPGLPRALDAICLKAMALEPADRYDSPRQLAEEVERWLADEPVTALKETPLERLSRWARRNRTWVRAGAAALILVTAVSVIATVLVNEQRQKAEQLAIDKARLADEKAQLFDDERLAREEAQRQLDRARRNWYAYQLSNVKSEVLTDPAWALELLNDRDTCPEDLREFSWAYYYGLCRRDRLVWHPHPERIRICLADFTDNDKTLVTVGAEGAVKLWDVTTGLLSTEFKTEQPVTAAAISGNRRTLATANQDGSIQLWDVPGGEKLDKLAGDEKAVRILCISHEAEVLLALYEGESCPIVVWDLVDLKRLGTFEGPTSTAALAVSPDGVYAAAGGTYRNENTGGLKVWYLPEMEEDLDQRLDLNEGMRFPHTLGITCLRFYPEGESFVAGSRGGALAHIDPFAEDFPKILAHTGTIHSIAVHPFGDLIVTASLGNPVEGVIRTRSYRPVVAWDPLDLQQVTYFAGIQEKIADLAFSAGGSMLATVGRNGKLRLFECEISTRLPHHNHVVGAAFSPDGKTFVAVVEDQEGNFLDVKHWNPASGADLEPPHVGPDHPVLLLPDGQVVDMSRSATRGAHHVEVVDTLSGETLTKLPLEPDEFAKALCPDRRLIAVTSPGKLKIWNLDSSAPRLQWTLNTEDGSPDSTAVAFSPNGELVAWGAGLQPGRVLLWNVSVGKEVARVDGLRHGVGALAFSPSGDSLAIALGSAQPRPPGLSAGATQSFEVVLWDVPARETFATLQGHTGAVRSVAFSPDGKTLATGSDDFTTRLWEPRFGIQLARLELPHDARFAVSFSPDSRALATAGLDGTVHLWRGAADEMVTEREATGLVGWLTTLTPLKSDVLEQIRELASLTDPVREAALRLAEDLKDDPRLLNEWSWSRVSRPGEDPAVYATALRCAQTACRLKPDDCGLMNTLGVAHYRCGQFSAAVDTLNRSRELYAELHGRDYPADLAFLAMAYFQLDRRDEAEATFEEFQRTVAEPGWSQVEVEVEEAQRFRREAEALIEEPPPSEETDQTEAPG